MLLAIDVGNSQTAVGLYDGDSLVETWRLTSSRERTTDELGILYRGLLAGIGREGAAVDGLALCSVVPQLTSAYRTLGRDRFDRETFVIDHRTIPDLPILNHDPATVGADRLVNAVALRERYGAPGIVVDLGTATTLDVVDRDGAYAGGVIAPGIATSAAALFQRGARLARVEILKPERVVGRSTEESIQAGIFFGAVGTVDSLVGAVRTEMEFPSGIPVVATGGLAPAIAASSRVVTAVDETLTLEGIRLVWERSRG